MSMSDSISPITSVRLLDGLFKERQEINERFLAMVEPDRLLAGFREQAGLPVKASRYGGWESKDIHGHSLGHYLSAVARAGMADRVDTIVDELAACQDRDGYVMTAPKRIFEEVRAGKIEASGFALNGVWVPLYTMHKVIAGLRDAGTPKALDIAHRLLSWLNGILAPLTPDQIQQFLACEHGGMLEVLADLGCVDMAERFFIHRAVLDPLLRGEDKLDGLHGNTIIPKVIGLARLYELTGKPDYRLAVETFWDRVVNHRSFCTGGHGASEHFFPPEQFPEKLTPHTCETCNTYNMLKLTGHLFAWAPKDEHMDFVERALLNHLVANIGREPGEYGYFLALGSVATKVFSKPFEAWWCCVGTGMENPTRYGEHIYRQAGDTLHVNLFMASEVTWTGVTLRQETRFPEDDTVTFTVACREPVRFVLKLRQPAWCGKIKTTYDRVWRNGDRIEVRLPMTPRFEPLPHSGGRIVAVMKGPTVMAGLVPGTPATERFGDHLLARGKTDAFPPILVDGKTMPDSLEFVPLYKVYEEPYAVYFPVLTGPEWTEREAALRAEQEQRVRRDASTLDVVEPGFQQSEVEHNLRCERSETGDLNNRKYREGEWFSYDVAVDPVKPADLVVTCWGGQWEKRLFDILVDGTKVASPELQTHRPGEFVDFSYGIPPALTAGKTRVTVRFQNRVPGIFGVRMVLHET